MTPKEAAEQIEATPEFNKANKATDGRIVAIYDPNTRTAGYKVGTGKRPRDSHLFDVEGPTFYTDTAAYLDTTAKLYGGSKSAEAPRGISAQDYLAAKNDPRAAALGVVIAAANLPLQISTSTATDDRAPRQYTLTTEDNRSVFRGTYADALVYLGRQIEAGPR